MITADNIYIYIFILQIIVFTIQGVLCVLFWCNMCSDIEKALDDGINEAIEIAKKKNDEHDR